ncbi:hypothetical protein GQ43DRAFT_207758 [Delitschia confertaspora ATCC 74209]|uniref:Uncharacterized protein n=1 Tax=Delitschia confertaspora ATCC 74209 TaxID=1513339 RepID=A0A9P4JDF5_9PLEO|nr:hypothetical protein GQ43DRAFT_207758 [Delitschia confertaspora ATCC 74209]
MQQIQPPTTWQTYHNRAFCHPEVVYSSLVYLYDMAAIAIYIMKTFASTGSFSPAMISAVSTKLAIWKSFLPACKSAPMRKDSTVDEMIFLAHMLYTIIIINTHRPLSSLAYSIPGLATIFFLFPIPLHVIPLHTAAQSAHTARVLKATEIQTKLLSIPCDVECHPLFVMGVLVSSTAAQISACRMNSLLVGYTRCW